MLVDSHCHLDRLELSKYPTGLDGAVEAAHAQGVSHMLCVCISEKNKNDVLAIAHKYPNIYASVGVHPTDVEGEVVSCETLKEWAEASKVVAIGETGLDYYHSQDFVAKQRQSFIHHLEVAGDLALPVIVHTRNAREDTIALIREHGNQDSAGVMHCFTEDWGMARKALDLNFYISISGIVTFNSAAELRDVVRQVPIDRLLVETDSPYLAPVPYRGKPNEPKYVKEVAQYIADLKGLSFDDLCEVTSANFFRLFPGAQAKP
ncbi:MAG: TatD DNase family protein [Lentisphaeria bacterium]|jgi:TatD DNase family protein